MKLLIADDHTLFRDSLVQYIERAEERADVTVTKDFYDAYECLKQDDTFDLVLLDLRMPGMEGLDGFKKIREEFPEIKSALMSGVAEPDDVRTAMDFGASGYFPKTLSGKALVKSIQQVLAGERFVPIENNTIMPSYYTDKKRINFTSSDVMDHEGETQSADVGFNLTPREKEVVSYLAEGASNKDIAAALGLQVVTVKLHVRGVCRKLQVDNRTQAALKAVKFGLAEEKKAVI